MKISRRKFLAAVPIAAGAALCIQGKSLARFVDDDEVVVPNDVLASCDWETFLPLVGTDFSFVDARGEAWRFQLASMDDMTPSRVVVSGPSRCFALRFKGPINKSLRQGTYNVNHFLLGDFNLFITNGGRVKRNTVYTAVVNHLVG